MNSKFLEKIITFREHRGFEVTKNILSRKIQYQFGILYKKSLSLKYISEILSVHNIQEVMLVEARAAKEYWKIYGDLMRCKVDWFSRIAHNKDIFNIYIDIGYHYLMQKMKKIFDTIELPANIGFFHKAQSKNSLPLIYDCMEWVRPMIVDRVILNHFRKKKLKMIEFDKKIINKLLSQIKKEFERRYFHKKLGYCITLEYWIKLYVLDLQKSVNFNKEFKPIYPSVRHENRCNGK